MSASETPLERARVTAVLTLPGVVGPVTVHGVRGHEEVSRGFSYEVDFSAPDISPEESRGAVALLHVQDAYGNERYVSGVVEGVQVASQIGGRPRMRITLTPAQSLLRHRHGFRIFQELSVPEIVQQVFKDAGYAAAQFTWKVKGGYPKREYCVQYDETEWSFVCRLLEDEGIWFAFEHSEAAGHVMVLSDSSATAPPAEPQELAFHYDAGAFLDLPRAWAWAPKARVCVRKVTLRDYDQQRPSLDMTVSAEVSGDERGSMREWYEYPGGYSEPEAGKRIARLRLEELQCDRKTASANTNALWVMPGHIVTLLNHPLDDGDHFVRRIDWTLRLDEETGEGVLVDRGPASNVVKVQTMPKARPFRPARTTTKPRVVGMQTALVTGPPGEEIFCDDLGRVKVQFAWDREGELDGKTSCWMRVAQPQLSGAMMIPRVGWEVLVEFIEGGGGGRGGGGAGGSSGAAGPGRAGDGVGEGPAGV